MYGACNVNVFFALPPGALGRGQKVKYHLIIPPANFVCGGVYCFHVVCACVRASVHPSVRNVLFFSSPEPKAHG